MASMTSASSACRLTARVTPCGSLSLPVWSRCRCLAAKDMEDARSEFGEAGVGRLSCWHQGGLMVCVGTIQVLHSLQRSVLRVGGRRRLQEGGRKHQVSHLSLFHRRRSTFPQQRGGGSPFSCSSLSRALFSSESRRHIPFLP